MYIPDGDNGAPRTDDEPPHFGFFGAMLASWAFVFIVAAVIPVTVHAVWLVVKWSWGLVG